MSGGSPADRWRCRRLYRAPDSGPGRSVAALLLLLLVALPARPTPAIAESLPVEWLPVSSRYYEEIFLLYAEGLLDTTVALSMHPKARVDLARWTASAERPAAASSHPGVRRLRREFSRERVRLGLAPDPLYTPPLVEIPRDGVSADDGATVRLTLIPYLDAAFERRFDGTTRLADRSAVGARLGLQLGPIFLYQDLFAGRYDGGRRFSDAIVNNTDFLVYSEDFYASARTPWIDLSLGRTRHTWGPGPGSTLLHSREAGPMTHFSYSASLFGGKLTGRALHADVDAAVGARLAEHGLEWVPTPCVQLSLFEAARYSSSQWEPLYVLALLPYTLVQKMLEQDALGDAAHSEVRNNVVAGLGARLRVARGHVLYGEFLVDDINLEASGSPVRMGYQLGWLGARRVGDGRLFGGLEWSRVNRYVYAVYYGESFLHQERGIGYPLGPDVRAVAGRAGYDFNADWRAAVTLGQTEKGEGQLGEFYDPAGPPASGGDLLGAVTTRFLGAEVNWMPRDGVEIGAEGTARWFDVAAADGEWSFRLHLLVRR